MLMGGGRDVAPRSLCTAPTAHTDSDPQDLRLDLQPGSQQSSTDLRATLENTFVFRRSRSLNGHFLSRLKPHRTALAAGLRIRSGADLAGSSTPGPFSNSPKCPLKEEAPAAKLQPTTRWCLDTIVTTFKSKTVHFPSFSTNHYTC